MHLVNWTAMYLAALTKGALTVILVAGKVNADYISTPSGNAVQGLPLMHPEWPADDNKIQLHQTGSLTRWESVYGQELGKNVEYLTTT